jgi:hypothetical protein
VLQHLQQRVGIRVKFGAEKMPFLMALNKKPEGCSKKSARECANGCGSNSDLSKKCALWFWKTQKRVLPRNQKVLRGARAAAGVEFFSSKT